MGDKVFVHREGMASGSVPIGGARLADGAPIMAHVSDGYGPTGLLVAGISFPGEGCHAVTVVSGRATMTFVTLVRVAAD